MESIFSEPYYINLTSTYIKLFTLQTLKDAGKLDITLEQYGILYMLTKENGLYQRQFSKTLMKDRPNITRMLDILEEKKLLYREKDPTNRRILKIFITDEGRKLVKEYEPTKQKILKKITEPLSKKEIDTLMNLMTKIRDNLESSVNIQI